MEWRGDLAALILTISKSTKAIQAMGEIAIIICLWYQQAEIN